MQTFGIDKPGTCCWAPIWLEGLENCGLEYVVVADTQAHSTLLAVDEGGCPFRLIYRLGWDEQCRIREADLEVHQAGESRALNLRADGAGRWQDAAGQHLPALEGCIDIDIWPTPLTNSLPLWRSPLQVGQRQEFRMAWVFAPRLSVDPQRQAYTRIGERRYLFESLDGSGFRAELPLDENGVVTDYPDLFRRLP